MKTKCFVMKTNRLQTNKSVITVSQKVFMLAENVFKKMSRNLIMCCWTITQ